MLLKVSRILEASLSGYHGDGPSLSLSFRRPHLLPFTQHMDKCLETLETSRRRAATDAVLAAWVRLQHIVDLSATALGLRNCDTEMNISDAGTQLSVRSCSKQLENWRRNIDNGLLTGNYFLAAFRFRSPLPFSLLTSSVIHG